MRSGSTFSIMPALICFKSSIVSFEALARALVRIETEDVGSDMSLERAPETRHLLQDEAVLAIERPDFFDAIDKRGHWAGTPSAHAWSSALRLRAALAFAASIIWMSAFAVMN